jgi:peptide/nickel transport system substrate-binding protein
MPDIRGTHTRRSFLTGTTAAGVAVLGAGGLAGLLAACGGGSGGSGSATPAGGGALVIAFPNQEAADAKSMDPNIGGGTTYVNSIYGAMYDQLVYQDPKTGKVVPGLARSWEMAPDGKTYTFHLTTAAKFWDGSPVTAEDVKYTLDRAVNKEYLPGNAYVSALMANYGGAEVVNPSTVRVVLRVAQANFLPSVVGRTYLAIVPRAYVEKVGVQAFGQQKPMGSGPFRFVEWEHGDHITVKRNPAYAWGPGFFRTAGKAPLVEAIRFRFIPDATTRVSALQSGQINALIGIAPFDQAGIKSDQRFHVQEVHKNGQPGGLNFNTQRAPASDPAVREAVAYAIDREALNKSVYSDTNFPAYHILEDRMGEWVNPKAAYPRTDVSRARKVLEEAGWRAGQGGVRAKGGRSLSLKAITSPDLEQAMTVIQSQVAKAGIRLDIQVMSPAGLSNVMLSEVGDFDVAWRNAPGWTNEDPYLLYSLFDSRYSPPAGTSNYSRVRMPDVDKLLEAASVEQDRARRKELFYQAQVKLVDTYAFIPLLSMNQNIATVKGVNGLMPDIRGTYTYFEDVWLDGSIQSKWA